MSWENKVQNLLGHCTAESAFGGTVKHIPKIGQTQDFKGIWSETYLSVNPEDGVMVSSADPNVGVRLSDLKTPPQKGDVILRGGIRYYVRNVEADGEGGATLILEKEVCK